MSWITAQYAFRQRFPFSARRAFAWCIDYQPGDLELEGLDGHRTVRWLADDTVLLTDLFRTQGRRPVTKVKLVRIQLSQRSWTSTHLVGPTKHSQFLYQILSDGPSSSHLEFTGLQAEPRHRPVTAAQRTSLSRRLRVEDAGAWRMLGAAMRRDLA